MSTIGAASHIEKLDEINRLRAVNKALRDALELFVEQWNACGPNSDFGRYFSNVRIAAEAAIAHAKDQS